MHMNLALNLLVTLEYFIEQKAPESYNMCKCKKITLVNRRKGISLSDKKKEKLVTDGENKRKKKKNGNSERDEEEEPL